MLSDFYARHLHEATPIERESGKVFFIISFECWNSVWCLIKRCRALVACAKKLNVCRRFFFQSVGKSVGNFNLMIKSSGFSTAVWLLLLLFLLFADHLYSHKVIISCGKIINNICFLLKFEVGPSFKSIQYLLKVFFFHFV